MGSCWTAALEVLSFPTLSRGGPGNEPIRVIGNAMAKTTSIDIILVRCGRTEWDDHQRLQGRTDLPLSESGRQAVAASVRDLASELNGQSPSTVYCGSDEASVETAKMLAQITGAKVKSLESLAGMNLGVWDGLLETELMERFPSAYKEWRERPGSVNPPEGESFDDLTHRLRLSMCKLLEKANGRPVAFVLRPISYGYASCWLSKTPLGKLWSILDDGPQAKMLTIDRTMIRSTMEELKAGA